MANTGLTLCYQVDAMMNKFMDGLEHIFVTEGGIKERMFRARTGFRQQQDQRLATLEQALPDLERRLAEAEAEATHWQAAYNDLRARAIKAYNELKEEVERLKKEGKKATTLN